MKHSDWMRWCGLRASENCIRNARRESQGDQGDRGGRPSRNEPMRTYRWLLRRFLPSLDRDYGGAMEETFARRLADARAAGVWRLAQMWPRELMGLIAIAADERWSHAAREKRRRQRQELRWRAGRMDGM